MAEAHSMRQLIERKKVGERLTDGELAWICNGYVAGEIPDYQMAAWLMAVRFQGLDADETVGMTRALIETGETLRWPADMVVVDKHSTGGVGDKTSLVVVPLLAAAGLTFVKMSGRGLGHTGGTLDKLESIPGFNVGLTLHEVRQQVRRIGCALIGQTAEMVPGDGAIYALRDVTSTVDSVPLIASSIMSKKLAMGARALVLDVKWGSGAFMTDFAAAEVLARRMVEIGTGFGVPVRAVMSPMEEPLGCAVGNALEVAEALETLKGGGPGDLRRLAIELGAHLLVLTEREPGLGEARDRLSEVLDSGAGLAKMADLIEAQGGNGGVTEDPDLLPAAPVVERYEAPRSGWVQRVDARAVADVALNLGAGRREKGDEVDHRTGVVVRARGGDQVEAGQTIAEIHAASAEAAAEARAALASVIHLAGTPQPALTADYEIIYPRSVSASTTRPASS